jgi:hypothetical protein
MRSLCVLLKLIPAIASAVWLSGCSVLIPGPLEPAIGQDQVELATRGFLDSSIVLARAFSYQGGEVDIAPVKAAANKIIGIGDKRTYRVEALVCPPPRTPDGQLLPYHPPYCSQFDAATPYGTRASIIREYILNGLHLSQLLCRNYLAGLSDKNSAFTAIKKEFNIAGGLAQLTMAAAKASARSIAYFGAVESFINASLENFGEFEYLTPDQSTLQDLVFKAQTALGAYYATTGTAPETLVGAIDAVHRIDSQCTRPGLRHLINRSLAGVQVKADPGDGTLMVSGTDKLGAFDTVPPGAIKELENTFLHLNQLRAARDKAQRDLQNCMAAVALAGGPVQGCNVPALQTALDKAQGDLDAAQQAVRFGG